MLKLLDEKIRKIFKTLLILTGISFFIGLIFNIPEFLSLGFGIAISLISNFMIYYSSYQVVYQKKGRGAVFIDYTKRYMLYSVALYFVYYLSKKYFKNSIEINMILAAIGFLSMSISLKIYYFIKRERR